jgi:hypothetical protein
MLEISVMFMFKIFGDSPAVLNYHICEVVNV